MSRYEYFGGLLFLGCINGLGSRVIGSVRSLGWADALFDTFGVSLLVWIACYKGVGLTLQDATGQIRPADLVIGAAVLLLISLPLGGASWLAVTLLALYVLWAGSPSDVQRRGTIILLAVTFPMLWSRIVFRYFANLILTIDAALIGLLLGTGNAGNVVPFRDGSGSLMILPACSSLANVSLAVLAWVTITNWLPRKWSFRDLGWCAVAAVSVIAVNVTRISLMGLSQQHYNVFHSQIGDMVTNLLLLSLILAICLLGARSESTVRA